ncbi:MAG: hypothetical protein JXK94_13480 [Deltaproteobacteria bacterium]|nr:hypothetical protein [Deltaproteobacteria bacterium]
MLVEGEGSAFEIVPGSHVLAEQEDGSEYRKWSDLSPEERANYENLAQRLEHDLKED